MRYDDARQEFAKIATSHKDFDGQNDSRKDARNRNCGKATGADRKRAVTGIEVLELAILLAVDEGEPLGEATLIARLAGGLPEGISICPEKLSAFLDRLVTEGWLARGQMGRRNRIYCLSPTSEDRIGDLMDGPFAACCARLTSWSIALRLGKIERDLPVSRPDELASLQKRLGLMADYAALRLEMLEDRLRQTREAAIANGIMVLLIESRRLQHRIDALCSTARDILENPAPSGPLFDDWSGIDPISPVLAYGYK